MKRIIPIALVFLLAVAMAFGCSGKAAAPENGVYYSSQAKADYAYDEPEAPMEMADTAYGYEGNTAAVHRVSTAGHGTCMVDLVRIIIGSTVGDDHLCHTAGVKVVFARRSLYHIAVQADMYGACKVIDRRRHIHILGQVVVAGFGQCGCAVPGKPLGISVMRPPGLRSV